MATQQGGGPQNVVEDPPWMIDLDSDDEGESATLQGTLLVIIEGPLETNSISGNDNSAGLPGSPPDQGPYDGPYSGDSSSYSPPWRQKYGWSTQTISTPPYTPLQETYPTTASSISSISSASGAPGPPPPTGRIEFQGPSGRWQHKDNDGGLIAVAAVVPIVVLLLIGAGAFYFLRRRKRKRQVAASQMTPQEMKMQMHPAPSIHPYMAPIPMPPPFEASRSLQRSTHEISAPAPVILGPISSGANGAYQTGIDTSDMISVNSSDARPVDPFADNNSIAEPPPPYRPHSVAPPSFVSTSRQSSVRTIGPPPVSSQTHLIERSPFDDPSDHEDAIADNDDDDDTISELSGPTLRRSMDAMSAVSDLSYQNEPTNGRSI